MQIGTLTLDNPFLAAPLAGVTDSAYRSILSEMRYQKEDTVLCEFLYEGEKPGSRAAYQTVQNALKALKADYPHLYISETDISPF